MNYTDINKLNNTILCNNNTYILTIDELLEET